MILSSESTSCYSCARAVAYYTGYSKIDAGKHGKLLLFVCG